MSGKGFKPRERSIKKESDTSQKFDCISHFMKLRGGEGYRCIICPHKQEFVLLSDALDHESSSEHVLARREIDRPPPPVKFNFIPDGGGDDFELEYDSTQGSWQPRSTAQQRDAPISEYTHNTASSSSSQPSQTTPVPAVAPTNKRQVNIDNSDWHTTLDSWSELPNAHFMVPRPALPSDPPGTVYDLFGASVEVWDDPAINSNLNNPTLPSEPLGPLADHFAPELDELTPPPVSPPAEELLFNPWLQHTHVDPESDWNSAQLPEDAEKWWPFSSREEALFCLMTAFPRAVFSGKELDVVRWFAVRCNIPGMPSQSTVQSRFEHIIKLLGLESRLVQSKLGNYFALNSLAAIIRNEMANPLIHKELVFYPQDDGKAIRCATNGQRWLEEVDASLAAPMVRKPLPHGHQDYYVFEPFLASVPFSSDNPTLVPRPFLPIRYFQHAGDLFAHTHPLIPTDSGYIVDGDNYFEIPLSSFLVPLPDLRSEHGRYGLPPPDNILGIQTSNLDHMCPWERPIENPWRKKAKGKQVLSVPIWLYCDDTSGNTSKKWNKHNSFLFTLAGLLREVAQLPYNVHFLATSNIASLLEMLHEVVEELSHAREDGIEARDCNGEETLYIPWVYAMQGDNPMQSELCSHIGMTGKFFCRVCQVRGKDKDRVKENDGEGDMNSEAQRIAEFMQIHTPRNVTDTLASLKVQEITALRGTFSSVDNEARKTGVKDKYFSAFLAIMKEHQDNQKEKNIPTGPDFLQQLRKQMPERLFNPALFIPDLDANQDTPVEILHVILLGIVKYFWRDAVAHQTAEGKETLKARISSLDVSGLGLSPLCGATLVQYAGSLTGHDFRAIIQIGPLVLYGLVPSCVYNAWLALSRLGPLAFQQEIYDIDVYSGHLTSAINALLDATVRWTPQWFNKPKFHILLHLPGHVLRFGPAILFATETFESYNFVIRLRSVHSNRHAPSHDIGRAFSRLQAIHHLVSGGWVNPMSSKSTDEPPNTRRQARQAVLDLRNDPEFMSLMGMSSVISTGISSYGNYSRQSLSVQHCWADTMASRCSAGTLPQDLPITLCDRVVLKNHDVARCDGYVLITHQGSTSPARILEILVAKQQVLGLTVQISCLLPKINPYEMPGIAASNDMVYIPLDDVLCSLSERQQTTHLGQEVKHTGNLHDFILNTAGLRSSYLIQKLSPPPNFSCSPELIAQIAQETVADWQANEAKAKEEKQRKEDEKLRKAEERDRKKQERELRRAEQQAVAGLSGPGKRKRSDKPSERILPNSS
ncbi:hypothetical protein FRC11_005490 [Ceratobasidium sp. 423]|nr:hypothetical protein FRC11_005490 [Ceratobasidium sp. 423]